MKFEKPKVSSSTPFKTEFKNAKRKSRDFNVIKQKSLTASQKRLCVNRIDFMIEYLRSISALTDKSFIKVAFLEC